MASARCGTCGGDTSRMDRANTELRRRTHRRNPAGIRPVSIDHDPTCPEHPTNRGKIKGEYIVEVREAGTHPDAADAWKPAIAFDPLPDCEDMDTERALQRMRDEVAKLNRQAGWYQFRTTYVFPPKD